MTKSAKLSLSLAAAALLLLLAWFGYRYLSAHYQPDSFLNTDLKSAPDSTAPDNGGDAPTAPTDSSENSGEGSAGDESDEPILAPDFTVYDGDGNAVSLYDYIGKPLIVNFWASWCGPCKEEMPHFEKLYAEHGDEVQFLMVNLTGGRETLEAAKAYIAENAYTFPVLYDTDLNAATVYGVSSIPATLFIQPDGYVLGGHLGTLTEVQLATGIDMLLESAAQ